MTLFIFTSAWELQRAVWAKWHLVVDCDDVQEVEAPSGGRQRSARLTPVSRAAAVPYDDDGETLTPGLQWHGSASCRV